MGRSEINAVLEFAADLNAGPDNNCTFELEQLEPTASLGEALELHFASIVNWKTQSTHPPEHWHIQIKKVEGTPHEYLARVLREWLFEMPHSPHLVDDREWVKKNVCENLARQIIAVAGEPLVYEVQTSPPVWYEAHWRDVAISSNLGHWLLHLGVTD